MGLDMYLTKKTYVKVWEHMKPEERFAVSIKKGGKIFSAIKPERVSYIIEEVGYWRKANQIHNWFVENVQDGKDECQESYVSRKQLQQLLDLCNKVLSAKEQAVTVGAEVLPTKSGFFFGSTEYDSYYLDDLSDTKKILEGVLSGPEGEGDFYYRASW